MQNEASQQTAQAHAAQLGVVQGPRHHAHGVGVALRPAGLGGRLGGGQDLKERKRERPTPVSRRELSGHSSTRTIEARTWIWEARRDSCATAAIQQRARARLPPPLSSCPHVPRPACALCIILHLASRLALTLTCLHEAVSAHGHALGQPVRLLDVTARMARMARPETQLTGPQGYHATRTRDKPPEQLFVRPCEQNGALAARVACALRDSELPFGRACLLRLWLLYCVRMKILLMLACRQALMGTSMSL
jgi:hypothetical protein